MKSNASPCPKSNGQSEKISSGSRTCPSPIPAATASALAEACAEVAGWKIWLGLKFGMLKSGVVETGRVCAANGVGAVAVAVAVAGAGAGAGAVAGAVTPWSGAEGLGSDLMT